MSLFGVGLTMCWPGAELTYSPVGTSGTLHENHDTHVRHDGFPKSLWMFTLKF